MENDNASVGVPSGPRVLASRSLRPIDRDGFDVAIAARFAVNENSELSAEWISNLHLPIMGKPRRPAVAEED